MHFDNKKKCNYLFVTFLITFIFFLYFFIVVHPLVFFDSDDWFYLTYVRHLYPIWGDMEPTKVFSEVGMSFVALLSNLIIKPLLPDKDFVVADSIGNGIVIALFIGLYVTTFFTMLNKKFEIEVYESMVLSAVFIILHFLIFRTGFNNNGYLFHTTNVTCLYHYLLPAIINSSLVLWVFSYDIDEKNIGELSVAKKNILLVAVCMALFSHLFASVIFSVFIGSKLLISLFLSIKNKAFSIKDYCKNNKYKMILLICWLVIQIMEANGQRALTIRTNNYFEELSMAFHALLGYRVLLNKAFIIFVVVVLILFVISVVIDGINKKNSVFDNNDKNIFVFILSLILISAYLVLLCGATGFSYIQRTEVTFGIFFFGFIIVFIAIDRILKSLRFLRPILLILCFVLFFETNTALKTFKESNILNADPKLIAKIDRDILNQFSVAQKNGEDGVIINVPLFDSNDNWPISTYSNIYFSAVANKYGYTSDLIQCLKIYPTKDKNKEFGIE